MNALKILRKIIGVIWIVVMIAWGYFLFFDYHSPWMEWIRPTAFGVMALDNFLSCFLESEYKLRYLLMAILCMVFFMADLFE